MYTQNKILLVFLTMTALLTSITSTTINYAIAHNNNQQVLLLKRVLLHRDSVTVLLEGKSINPDGHIHLYDTGKFHIMDGHVAVKIPCNNESQPLLELLGGVASDKTFMKKLELHHVANMLSQVKHVCIIAIFSFGNREQIFTYRYSITQSFRPQDNIPSRKCSYSRCQ